MTSTSPPLSKPSWKGSVALVLNGAIHDFGFIKELIQEYRYCVAVDGGLIHCDLMGIRPDLVIGDFDSIPAEVLSRYADIPQHVFPVDKDKTDAELAVDFVNVPTVDRITLFGALEKRTDHALSNLYLLQRFVDKMMIESELETLVAIRGNKTIDCEVGQTLSLIPMGTCSQVTTKGLKWELEKATLDSNFVSLSNICLGDHFEVSVAQGVLLCCRQRLLRELQN